MKNELKELEQEHSDSIERAEAYLEIVEQGTPQALAQAVESIRDYYADELETHFQHEERTIFAPIFQHYREHIGLATNLLKEHGKMRLLIPRMSAATAKQDVSEFAHLLKSHTLTEQNSLFPIIEAQFSEEQLEAILKFEPLE